MLEKLEDSEFNRKMICSDWRFSSSIIGLKLYFDFHEIDYLIREDYILYNYESIEEDKYLSFAENFFEDYMHHRKIEKLFSKNELDEKEEKEINDLMSKNVILKATFKGVKFPEYSRSVIESKIEDNRKEIIKNTFLNGKKLYKKFSNSNCFFKEEVSCCRLNGFYFDGGRRSKAYGYMFDANTFAYEDCLEFDFIPFAFTKTDESIFVNNNSSIENLWKTYNSLNNEHEINFRNALFNAVNKSKTFIDYDVEAIIKKTDENKPYETLFIRKSAINIFEKIEYYDYFKDKFIKISDKNYLNLEKEITNRILNLQKFDDLIIFLVKKNKNKSHISTLIKTNILIYEGDEKMKKNSFIAKQKATEITRKMNENKVSSFKNKLLSAIAIGDYDSFNVILLKLSNFSGVEMSFAYDLFDDFESNKNIAFSFLNALGNYTEDKELNN